MTPPAPPSRGQLLAAVFARAAAANRPAWGFACGGVKPKCWRLDPGERVDAGVDLVCVEGDRTWTRIPKLF